MMPNLVILSQVSWYLVLVFKHPAPGAMWLPENLSFALKEKYVSSPYGCGEKFETITEVPHKGPNPEDQYKFLE